MTVMQVGILAEDEAVPLPMPPQNQTLWTQYLATSWREEHYQPINFNTRECSPIVRTRVSRARDGGDKPCYIFAEIFQRHLRNGVPTSNNVDLARKIRARGKHGEDDCGHIIGTHLGGKMWEFNLFPQDKTINRGWKGLNKWWRRGVEAIMGCWLSLPETMKPSVEFEAIFYYEDTDYPDRPNRAKFLITFKKEQDDDEDGNDDDTSEEVLNPQLTGELLNYILTGDEVDESVYQRISWANYAQFCGNNWRLYAKILEKLFKAILEVRQIPVPVVVPTPITIPMQEPRGSNTPFSWWDVVPIVGDVRSIIQGVEDAEDGNAVGATANILLGAGGLVLTALTLGTSSLIKEGGKVVAKEGVKEVGKEGGKQVLKAGTRHVVKEVVKDAVVITVKAAQVTKWVNSIRVPVRA